MYPQSSIHKLSKTSPTYQQETEQWRCLVLVGLGEVVADESPDTAGRWTWLGLRSSTSSQLEINQKGVNKRKNIFIILFRITYLTTGMFVCLCELTLLQHKMDDLSVFENLKVLQ